MSKMYFAQDKKTLKILSLGYNKSKKFYSKLACLQKACVGKEVNIFSFNEEDMTVACYGKKLRFERRDTIKFAPFWVYGVRFTSNPSEYRKATSGNKYWTTLSPATTVAGSWRWRPRFVNSKKPLYEIVLLTLNYDQLTRVQ